MKLEVFPIKIEKDVSENDDIVDLMLSSISKPEIKNNDIVVITQKIVSKQENRIVNLSLVTPSLLATGIASEYGKDPRIVEVILEQSKRIVRMSNGVIISETAHGFVCANAGVDESNVKTGFVTLLPEDADMSAKKLKEQIQKKTGKNVAILISDTFGRPFREGQTNCAIGISNMAAILDYAGTKDTFKRTLHVSAIATADEICSAAELVMAKAIDTPVVIIRNYKFHNSNDSIKKLLRDKPNDLFR